MANDGLLILEAAETLKRFKSNALARAREFSIDTVLPQYEKFYSNVLSAFN